MDLKTITNQIDPLLKEVGRARTASHYKDLSGGLPKDELTEISTRLKAAIIRLTTKGSVY